MHRREDTQPPKHQRGFTIVELLIVIVVIAILAAITIVAYNGVTSRANDSARRADANALMKKIEMRYVEVGEYGYGYFGGPSPQPESRDALLEIYGIQTLGSSLVICGYDDCSPSSDPADEIFDKSKVYLWTSEEIVKVSYWSNTDGHWTLQGRLASPNQAPDVWDVPSGDACPVDLCLTVN